MKPGDKFREMTVDRLCRLQVGPVLTVERIDCQRVISSYATFRLYQFWPCKIRVDGWDSGVFEGGVCAHIKDVARAKEALIRETLRQMELRELNLRKELNFLESGAWRLSLVMKKKKQK